MQRGVGEGRGVDASVPITKETPDSFSYRNLEGQRSNFDVNFCNGQAKCLELESYVGVLFHSTHQWPIAPMNPPYFANKMPLPGGVSHWGNGPGPLPHPPIGPIHQCTQTSIGR
jgi:hypothetical protein